MTTAGKPPLGEVVTPAPAAQAMVAHALVAQERLALLEGVLYSVDVGIVACNDAGRLTYLNPVAAEYHGLDADASVDPDQVAARSHLYRPDGVTPLSAAEIPLLRALREGQVRAVEMVIAAPGRPARLVRCDGRIMTTGEGTPLGAVVCMVDLTESRAARDATAAATRTALRHAEALAASEQRFRTAFELGPMPQVQLDAGGRIEAANAALARLLATSVDAVIGGWLPELVVPEHRDLVADAMLAALEGAPGVRHEVGLMRSDGSMARCELSLSAVSEGSRTYLLGHLADLGERGRSTDGHLSADPVTGLATRPMALEALRVMLTDGPAEATVTFVALDQFRKINESAGHHVGDVVLAEVAVRLRHRLRPQDLVARWGGDEFLLLTGTAAERYEFGDGVPVAERLAARVQAALFEPVATAMGTFEISASVGVTTATAGEHPATVVERARQDMQAEKGARKALRVGGMLVGAQRRGAGRMADLVASAVAEERLEVHYQPVVDLDTGATVGAEALLRMRDRDGVLVMPDAFIPLAEATGAIHELSAWTLWKSARQAVAWKARLPIGSPFSIGYNLSPRQLEDGRLLRLLDEVIDETGLAPDALVMELTEQLLTPHTALNRHTLLGIRERGVHLACDDFGVGHASVSYLADFPLNVIKIDRSWTQQLTGSGPSGRLARGVVGLAVTSGLIVVAEGIETRAEQHALQHQGVGLAQGYLYSRPVPAEAFVPGAVHPLTDLVAPVPAG